MEWKIKLYLVGKNNRYLKCLGGKNPFVIVVLCIRKKYHLDTFMMFFQYFMHSGKTQLSRHQDSEKNLLKKSVYSVEKF